jgi:hypothetical protein
MREREKERKREREKERKREREKERKREREKERGGKGGEKKNRTHEPPQTEGKEEDGFFFLYQRFGPRQMSVHI